MLPSSANRESFINQVRANPKPGHTLFVFYADLNRFKNINDSLGHEQGDDVMIDIQTSIADLVDEYDQESEGDYRHNHEGGDEMTMAFYVPESEIGLINEKALEIRELANGLSVVAPDGTRQPLGISIGISEGYDVSAADQVLNDGKEKLNKC